MAKTALVERNDALYHASLTNSLQWLEQQFMRNDDSHAVADELQRLNALSVRGQFPDISRSFALLKDIAKLRLDSEKTVKTPEPLNSAPPAAQPVDKAPEAE
jgi:uncharacterized protein HemX